MGCSSSKAAQGGGGVAPAVGGEQKPAASAERNEAPSETRNQGETNLAGDQESTGASAQPSQDNLGGGLGMQITATSPGGTAKRKLGSSSEANNSTNRNKGGNHNRRPESPGRESGSLRSLKVQSSPGPLNLSSTAGRESGNISNNSSFDSGALPQGAGGFFAPTSTERLGSHVDPAVAKRAIFASEFKKYDIGSTGALTREEMGQLLRDKGFCETDEQVQEALEKLDKEQTGQIELDEFLDWSTVARSNHINKGKLESQEIRLSAQESKIRNLLAQSGGSGIAPSLMKQGNMMSMSLSGAGSAHKLADMTPTDFRASMGSVAMSDVNRDIMRESVCMNQLGDLGSVNEAADTWDKKKLTSTSSVNSVRQAHIPLRMQPRVVPKSVVPIA